MLTSKQARDELAKAESQYKQIWQIISETPDIANADEALAEALAAVKQARLRYVAASGQ